MRPLLSKIWRKLWTRSDRRKPWLWAEDHVHVDETSSMPGRWRSDNSPWVREVLEEFANPLVRELVVRCSAQSAKTQTLLVALFWAIKNAPGPVQWVMAAADEAKEFVRTRLNPEIRRCKPVNDLLGGREPGLTSTDFPSAALWITGANSKSKLQSNPKRYLFLDEVRNYPRFAYEMVKKRVRSFRNSITCTISTPDRVGDQVDRAYLQGDQRCWHFACPKCGHEQQLAFKQLKWDENEITRPNGQWDFDKLAETIRFECSACSHPLPDTPVNRRLIYAGRWIRMNPRASESKVSFTWNALLPIWVRWRDVVEEFITSYAVLKLGDHEPYKTFINETLGEAWEDRLKEVTDFGALEHRRGNYSLGDPCPEGWTPIMAIDVQQDHYRFVVRAFGPLGASRLIAFGKVIATATDEELDALPAKYGVAPGDTVIDSGHAAARVYRICMRNKWKAFKGNDSEYFTAKVKDEHGNEKTVRRLWVLSYVDPTLGMKSTGPRRPKPIKLYHWSNPGVKDVVAEWMKGLGPDWTIPSDDSAEMRDYISQVTAQKRVEQINAKGEVRYVWIQTRKDNHYGDCEEMIGVAAMAKKLVGRPPARPRQAAAEPVEESGFEEDGEN